MSDAIQYKKLKALEQYLNKPLKIPMKDNKFFDIEVEYIKLSKMIYAGTEKETLRMSIRVTGDYMPMWYWVADGDGNKFIYSVINLNDLMREVMIKHNGQHDYIKNFVKGFMERKVRYFGFELVYIDKLNFEK